MTKRLSLILAIAVLLVVAAVLAAPSLIDWNSFRPQLARHLGTALNRPVAIDGRLSFSLLPAPVLSAREVHVANPAGAQDRDLVHVDSVEARVALLPLLSGRFESSSVNLVGLRVNLERLPDGHFNWQDQPSAAPAPEGGPKPAEPGQAPGAGRVVITRLGVQEGTLTFRRPGAAPLVLAVPAATVTGLGQEAVRFSADGRLAGVAFSAEGMTAPWSEAAPAPLSLTLGLAKGAGDLRLVGQVSGSGDQRAFKGKVALKAPDLRRFADGLGKAGSLPAVGPVELDAALSLTPAKAQFTGLSLLYPGGESKGAATAAFGAPFGVDLTLAANRLDLDALLPPAAARAVPPPAAPPTASAPGPGSAPAPAPAEPAADLALPDWLALTANLSADAVIWRGTPLRNARLAFALGNGDLTIDQAALSLPGSTDVNLFGYVAPVNGQPQFDGVFEASAEDLRGLLQWLKVDVAAVPAERLHSARLAGRMKGGLDQIDFEGAQLRVDGAQVDAAATLRLGAEPALGLTFAIDTLNADAYWPGLARWPNGGGKPGPAGPPQAASATPPAAAGPAPSSFNANLKGHVGRLILHGLTAQEVDFQGSWAGGGLSVQNLATDDLAGAQLRLQGGIGGLQGPQPVLRDLRYQLRTRQLGRLIGAVRLPFDPDRLGPVALSGTLNGTADDLGVELRGEAGGALVGAAGRIADPFAAAKVDLQVETSHSSTLQFVRLFAPDYHPPADPGAFAASAKVEGDGQALRLDDLRLKAGPLTAAGQARLALSGRPRIEASLTAGELPLDRFLPGQRQAGSRVREMVDAGLLIPTRRPPPRADGPGVGPDKVTPAPRPAVSSGDIPSRWSGQPYDFGWLGQVDLGLKLQAQAISWGKARLVSAEASLGLTGGALTVERLVGQLYGGAFSGNGKLSADGALNLQLALQGGQVRDLLMATNDFGLASGAVDADAAFSSSGQSLAEMIARLDGSGKLSGHDGSVRGFDLAAVDDRLQSATNPLGLLNLLQAGLTGGKTSFTALNGSFAVKQGLLAIDNLRLTADHGQAKASARVNLPDDAMDARIDFTLASAPSGPPLTVRLSGPLENPRRFLDINPIQGWLSQGGLHRGGR